MSLAATYKATYDAMYPNRLADQHNRVADHNLLNAVMEMSRSSSSILQTSGMSIEESWRRSYGTQLEVPILTKAGVTVTNSRSCSFTCSDSTSEMLQVTDNTYTMNICIDSNDYYHNAITKEADFGHKYYQGIKLLTKQVNQDLATFLDVNKTTNLTSSMIPSIYTFANDTLTIPNTRTSLSIEDIKTIMRENEFEDAPYYFLGNFGLQPIARFYENQGLANAVNSMYQFQDTRFGYTNAITNNSGMAATAYVMQGDTVGVAFRIPPTFASGGSTTKGHEFSSMYEPLLGTDMAVLYESDCSGNGTAIKESFQISVDVAIISQYVDPLDTRASGIVKAEWAV